ncbi:hypothetical protein Tco_1033825, partial [Tanacetum coccineum]
EMDIQEKDVKQSQKRKNQARNGKDKVKSKPKSVKIFVPAGSSSNVPADYVSAGHVLVPRSC